MAERRSFAKKIIDSDSFLDMPVTTRLLYYDLSMRADDDGFVDCPKKVMRLVGASPDDLKLLAAKQFIIPFDSGIVVIRHWRIHNYIQNDRHKDTVYQTEREMLEIADDKAYEMAESLVNTDCIQNGYRMDTLRETENKERREESSKEESKENKDKEKMKLINNDRELININNNSINNINYNKRLDGRPTVDQWTSNGRQTYKRFVPPSVDEVRRYCEERHNNVDPEAFVDFYESKGWMVGKNKMKSWKAAVRTWERSRNNQQGSHIQTQEEFEAELKKFMEAEGIE